MIVIADGDIAKNDIYPNGKPLPLGFNRFDKFNYGNKDFMMNCLEYMIDNRGIIAARNKEIKLRPMDQERAFREELFWQFTNLLLPIIILAIIGICYNYVRRRRFRQ
jgi:hypothetical protein